MNTIATPDGPHAGSPSHGGLWRVARTIAWRSLHTYVRRPDLFVPSLVFPLVFLASFAGGLSALGEVPGFHFPAGYTAFQFVFVLCQSAMFGGLFTGFTLAFDFESGFARRLMLAAEDRRGIALGYALVALTRSAITLSVVSAVALATGMRITGDGVDIVRPVWPGGAADAGGLRLGGRRGVSLPLDPGGPADANAGVPAAVPGTRVCAVGAAEGLDPLEWRALTQRRRSCEAGRGLISGVQDQTGLAFICAAALILVFGVWMLSGLRSAENSA